VVGTIWHSVQQNNRKTINLRIRRKVMAIKQVVWQMGKQQFSTIVALGVQWLSGVWWLPWGQPCSTHYAHNIAAFAAREK